MLVQVIGVKSCQQYVKIPSLEPTDITDTTVAHRHAKVNSDATAPEGRESLEGEMFEKAAEKWI